MTDPATRVALLARHAEEFTSSLPGVQRGSAGAIHRARVAIRRMREALTVAGLDRRVVRQTSASLKVVADALAPVREDDVLLELLAEPWRGARPVLDHLRAVIGADRARHVTLVQGRAATSARRQAARQLERLLRRVREPSPSRGMAAWRAAIERRMAKRAASLETAIDEAGVVYVPLALHRVRLAVKKLRYAIELWDDVQGRKVSPAVRTLKATQALLGRAHDLESLIAAIRVVEAGLGPDDRDTYATADRTVRAIEQAVRVLHGTYLKERSKVRQVCAAVGHARHSLSLPGEP